MKKVYLLITFTFICFYSPAQTITSAQSGNWFTPSTWVGGVVPGSNNDVVIDNGHTVGFQLSFISATIKSLTVNTSATLNMTANVTTTGDVTNQGAIVIFGGNPRLTVNQDLFNFGTITIASPMGVAVRRRLLNSGSFVSAGNSLLEVSGSLLENNGSLDIFQIWLAGSTEVKGSGSFTVSNSVLLMTGEGATVTINCPLAVPQIQWTGGACKVILENNDVQVNSIVGFSSTKYIVTGGTSRLIINNSNTTKTFPVGTIASYTPITVSGGNTGTHNFAARVKNYFSNPPADNAIVNREWSVEDLTGSANVDLSFQWNDTDETGNFNRTSCAVGQYNGSDWNAITPFAAATGTNPYSHIATGVTAFGNFFVGSSSSFSRIASAQSGNWSSPATWVGGVVPTPPDNASISPGHIINFDLVTATINALVVSNTASLQFNPGNTLIASSTIFNVGNISLGNSSSLRTGGDLANSGLLTPAAGALNTILSVGGNINNISGTLSAQSLYFSTVNLGNNTIAQSVNSNSSLDGFNIIELWNNGVPVTFNCPVNCATINFNGATGNLVLMNDSLGVSNTITGYNTDRYIQLNGSGQLLRTGIADPKFFPVGTVTSYTPLTISNGNVATETFSVGLSNTFSHPPFNNAVVQREWNISNVTGGANVDLTFQWNATDENPLFNRSLSYAGHYTSGTWMPISVLSPALGSNPYTKTVTGVSSFSPFAIGSSGALPLNWIYFKATGCNGKVCLEWATDNETNTDKFIVERSTNNQLYIAVDSVVAKNTNGIHVYNYTDDFTSSVLYYRIRQRDFDGRYSFSNTVKTNAINETVSIVPNPAKGIISIKNADRFDFIQFSDINGRIVLQLKLKHSNDSFDIGTLPKGIYLVRVVSANELLVIKLLKE